MSKKFDNLSLFFFESIYYMQLEELVMEHKGHAHVVDTGARQMLAVLEFENPRHSTMFELKYAEHFEFVDPFCEKMEWFEDYWGNKRFENRE